MPNSSANKVSEAVTDKGKVGYMYFRYTDQVTYGRDFSPNDFKVGTRIKVLPNQKIDQSFLNKMLGTSQGKTYYGKTGLSFDANNPKICGRTFTVKERGRNLKFTQPFPENMRNSYNSSFKLKVVVLE